MECKESSSARLDLTKYHSLGESTGTNFRVDHILAPQPKEPVDSIGLMECMAVPPGV